jgi:hypothetical protein
MKTTNTKKKHLNLFSKDHLIIKIPKTKICPKSSTLKIATQILMKIQIKSLIILLITKILDPGHKLLPKKAGFENNLIF